VQTNLSLPSSDSEEYVRDRGRPGCCRQVAELVQDWDGQPEGMREDLGRIPEAGSAAVVYLDLHLEAGVAFV